MDRQTMILMGGLVGVMVVSAILNSVTSDPFVRQYGFIILMVFFIGVIIMQDYVYTVEASKYLCLEAWFRPSDDKAYCWVKEAVCQYYPNLGAFVTAFKLAFPIEVKPFGKISEFAVHSTRHINDALRWRPGNVLFRETQIKHNKLSRVVLEQLSQGASDIERGYVKAVFKLREAGGYAGGSPEVQGFKSENELVRAYATIKMELSRLKISYQQKSFEANEEHKLRIMAEELGDKQRVEMQSLYKLGFSVDELALIKILALLKEVMALEDVAKKLKGTGTRNLIVRGLVIAVLILAVAFVLYSNPMLASNIIVWLNDTTNQIFILAVSVIALVIVYLITRMRRNKGVPK